MLEFDEASKQFGGLVALDERTFEARPGRLTGFLGPNAAGKTAAMRAVFGLVKLDAGSVPWRGVPVGRPSNRDAVPDSSRERSVT